MAAISAARARLGAAALAAAGVLFLLYPALRPWEDETTVEGATRAMSSGAWVVSHFFGMVGFILVPLGLLAVHSAVARTRAERLALVAVVLSWVGAGLILPYYGAEDFGLNAVARAAGAGQGVDLLALVEATRYNPVAIGMFGVGLLSLAAGATLASVAVHRSGVMARSSGIVFAVAFALYLPQFFTPAAVRIGHGVLAAVGSIWLALALWRVTPDDE